MNKIPWLDILKYILTGIGSAKGISKITAKAIVKYLIMWSGPKGWITSVLLSRAIRYGLIELAELRQEFKDNKIIREHKKEIPNGNTDKRKQLEKSILEGD